MGNGKRNRIIIPRNSPLQLARSTRRSGYNRPGRPVEGLKLILRRKGSAHMKGVDMTLRADWGNDISGGEGRKINCGGKKTNQKE